MFASKVRRLAQEWPALFKYWTMLEVANTLAYSSEILITAVKGSQYWSWRVFTETLRFCFNDNHTQLNLFNLTFLKASFYFAILPFPEPL